MSEDAKATGVRGEGGNPAPPKVIDEHNLATRGGSLVGVRQWVRVWRREFHERVVAERLGTGLVVVGEAFGRVTCV